jgi:phosphoribosyl 1,2-cyclic phosphodiesterase
MEVLFFGTRGSLPVPGPHTVRYGGNTSCTAVRSSRGTLVILDMGTGAFALGQALAAAGKPVKGHVLISHTHWDHIQGLPFFAPFFGPANEWDVYAPRGPGTSLRETLSGQMQYTYFPLELEQLGATIRYHDLVEGRLMLDDITVEAQYLNHPAMTLGYRLTADGVTAVYALDHEPFDATLAKGSGPITGADLRHAEFLADADLVIHDAQYLAEEYPAKVGWGHSTVEYALHVAQEAGVRRLALSHHDPNRSDEAIDGLIARFKAPADLELFAAAEGMRIDLAAESRRAGAHISHGGDHDPAKMAMTEPAPGGQSVLMTQGNPLLMERLAKILRDDKLMVATCDARDVAEAVQRSRPSLLIVVEGESATAAIKAVSQIRDLGEPFSSLPIILAGQSMSERSNEELGITDRLEPPFTDSYARTRLRAWLMRRACKWGLPPIPVNEGERLVALRALNILDTPGDPLLDSLVTLATDLFNVPIAAVTLVDEDRQWFKARCGLDEPETPRDESFCAHVVANPVTTIVPDTLLDTRFAENPGVTGPPYLRFYAGHPIVLSNGHCVGTLCIADVRPRQLRQSEMDRLAKIAALALQAIEADKI